MADQHVVPHLEGWAVKGEGNKRASSVCDTQAQAIRDAQRIAKNQHPDHYRPGLVVQINDHVEGFALGEKLEVIMVRDDMVKARSLARGGKIKPLPLSIPETFAVYKKDSIEICEGEHIRFTGNGRSTDGRRLNNKKSYRIDYVTQNGEIMLENGLTLPSDFRHFEYGYTATSFVAQGCTVDRLFLAQSAMLSYGASDARQFLVSISRGSKSMKFYPHDLEMLKQLVSVERERPMATEIFQDEPDKKVQEASGEKTSDRLGKETEIKLSEEIEREMEEELEIEM